MSTTQRFGGRYETLAEMARGAQGRVVLGRDTRTGRSVALKVWHLESERERRAYEAEAVLVAALEAHPGLPVYVDSMVDGECGVLVTEWVEGPTLERVVADDGNPGLAPSLALAYLTRAAEALDALHAHTPARIHGDVKPANLILTAGGSVVLVDFGSADRDERQGTPGFVAPEVAAGHPKSAASDLYSLAATAVTLIAGRAPVQGPAVDELDSPVRRALASGLRSGLALDPANRPVSAGELVEQLRRALEAEQVLSRGAAGATGSTPEPGARPGAIPFPLLLEGGGQASFVGRRDVLQLLHDARIAARNDGCQVALLVGEPGAGKTRAAAVAARAAFAEGIPVLFGQCAPGIEVPYQPFAEALLWQVAHGGGDRLGALAGELVRILPDLDRYVPGLPPPLTTDPRVEEHRLFDAVADWLIGTARPHGLVFLVDDLQWATRATLNLFQYVLRRAGAAGTGAPILFVATYRDTDLEADHPLLDVLPTLERTAPLLRIAMSDLTEPEVSELLVQVSGQELDDVGRGVARSLTEDSGGNPFFAISILRHLLETGGLRADAGGWKVEGDIVPPDDVQGALELRFRRLTPSAHASLSAASVIGMQFDLDLLSTLLGRDRPETLTVLDGVLATGLLDEPEPESFRFEHALVRSTLYEAIQPVARQEAHAGVLHALEQLGRAHPATLATHALASAPRGPALTTALEYALSAGEEALRARAFGDAESWSLRVLEKVDDMPAPQPYLVRALCLSGEAQRDQGDPSFRDTLLRAGNLALDAGLDESVVRAAIGNYRGTVSIIGKVDAPRVELLERAMARETGPDRRNWALLAATLAGDLTYDPETPYAVRLELVAAARSVARSSGDPRFLLEILLRTMAPAATPGGLTELVSAGCELVALADATGDPSLRVLARWATTTSHLPAGELSLFRGYLDEANEASRQNCPARVRWLAGLGRPQFVAGAGDLAGARTLNDELLTLGEVAEEPDALLFWSAVTFGIALLDGTGGDFADLAGATAAEFPDFPVWRIGHAVALGGAGRIAEGLDVLDRFGLRDVEAVPVDVLTLGCWSLLARAALHLDDLALAQALEPKLLDHLDAWGHTSVWILGPIRWDLARCCLVQRDWERAVPLLETAIADCERHDLPAHAAVGRLDLIRALLGRDGDGDRARAATEKDRAMTAATAFGLDRRVEELRELC